MRVAFGLALVVSLILVGCAPVGTVQGRVFDDAPTQAFVVGRTSREQAIAALGPPNHEVVRPDGLTILRWEYRRMGWLGPTQRRVQANFRDGRLIDLWASRRDEPMSVF